MRDLALTVLVFGLVPFILFHPYVGILAWCWLSYMNPHRLAWGFAWSMPFAQVVAVATLAGMALTRTWRGLPVNGLTVVWLSFIAWTALTTYFALNPVHAQQQWQQFMKIQIMALAMVMLVTNRRQVDGVIWIVAFSLGFYGVKGGIFTLLTGGQYRVWGPPKSMIEGNNELALALIITIPLIRYLQTTIERRWLRWGLTAAMILSGFAILGSYSRGAFLAASGMLAFLWLKSPRKLSASLVFAAVVLAILAFAPEAWFERISTIQRYEEDGSAMGRINAWYFAVNLASDHPFVGGGFDAFMPELFLLYAPDPYDFHDSHSIYFGVLGEHGFVGLTLFMGLGLLTFLHARRQEKYAAGRMELSWLRSLSAMVQVSVVGYAVGGAFLGLAYFDLAYHLTAVTLILDRWVQEHTESASTPGEKAGWGPGGSVKTGSGPAGVHASR